ncbi:hypothetical protein ABIA38_003432 [Embleya sp. AB8]
MSARRRRATSGVRPTGRGQREVAGVTTSRTLSVARRLPGPVREMAAGPAWWAAAGLREVHARVGPSVVGRWRHGVRSRVTGWAPVGSGMNGLTADDPPHVGPFRIERRIGPGGFGLHILDTVTTDWGVRTHRAGKTVRADIDGPRPDTSRRPWSVRARSGAVSARAALGSGQWAGMAAARRGTRPGRSVVCVWRRVGASATVRPAAVSWPMASKTAGCAVSPSTAYAYAVAAHLVRGLHGRADRDLLAGEGAGRRHGPLHLRGRAQKSTGSTRARGRAGLVVSRQGACPAASFQGSRPRWRAVIRVALFVRQLATSRRWAPL